MVYVSISDQLENLFLQIPSSRSCYPIYVARYLPSACSSRHSILRSASDVNRVRNYAFLEIIRSYSNVVKLRFYKMQFTQAEN